MISRRIYQSLLLLFLTFSVVVTALPQSKDGTIRGIVADEKELQKWESNNRRGTLKGRAGVSITVTYVPRHQAIIDAKHPFRSDQSGNFIISGTLEDSSHYDYFLFAYFLDESDRNKIKVYSGTARSNMVSNAAETCSPPEIPLKLTKSAQSLGSNRVIVSNAEAYLLAKTVSYSQTQDHSKEAIREQDICDLYRNTATPIDKEICITLIPQHKAPRSTTQQQQEPMDKILTATIIAFNLADGTQTDVVSVAQDGKYHLNVKAEGLYHLTAIEEGYVTKSLLLRICHNQTFILLEPRDQNVDDTAKDNVIANQTIELVSENDAPTDEQVSEKLTNTTEYTHRYVFTDREAQSLPLPGVRSFDSLALLAPGVSPPPETFRANGPGVSAGVGMPGQFAVNGLRSRENNFAVDGSDNNDEDIGTRRQGFVLLVPQSIESLQEFQIITALGDTRFGRNIGGQVNALSKGGGNRLHGSLNTFFTNDRLNARDFFDTLGSSTSEPLRTDNGRPVLLDGAPVIQRNPAPGEDPFKRLQIGGVLGGPLKIPRTFFFASSDYVKIASSREVHFAVPTVKQRGLFDTGDTGLRVADTIPALPNATPIFPASIPGDAVFSLYPFPNDAAGPYGKNTYTASLPADGRGSRFSIKLDHQFDTSSEQDTSQSKIKGDKRQSTSSARCGGGRHPWEVWKIGCSGDSLSGRYNFTDDTSTLPATGGAIFSSLRPRVRTQNLAFFLNRTFSSQTADTIRFSIGRTSLDFDEVRDPSLLPSAFSDTPFLLNAPLLLNVTRPDTQRPATYISASSPEGNSALRALGFRSATQTEQITGPLGQVMLAGFSPVGVDVFNFPQARENDTIQIADTLSHFSGKHYFTFGFDVRKSVINDTIARNFRPLAVFGGIQDEFPGQIQFALVKPDASQFSRDPYSSTTLAAAGVPVGLFQTFALNPDSSIGIRFTQTNFFFQDEVHVGPRLVINFGLRYENNNSPETVGQKLEKALNQEELKGLSSGALNQCLGQGAPRGNCQSFIDSVFAAFPADFKLSFNTDRNHFNPRIGFALDPTGDGRTAIRGGFGLYSGQFEGIVIDQSRNAFPSFTPLNLATGSTLGGNRNLLFNAANPTLRELIPILDFIVPGTLNTLRPGTNPVALLNLPFNNDPARPGAHGITPSLNLVLPQSGLKVPYAYHYSLMVERQVFKYYLVEVAYVGTRGIRLLRVSTPNLGVNHNVVHLYDAVNLAATGFPRIFGDVFSSKLLPQGPSPIPGSNPPIVFTTETTLFESSAASTFHSLQAVVSRRYSHHYQLGVAFTYSHAIDDASDFFDNAGAFALPQDSISRSERASSNFDTRLRSTAYFVWDVPYGENKLYGGWQLSGILTLQSGPPFTVNSAIDVNHDGNLTDRLNTTNGLVSGNDRRTTLQFAPGTNTLDLLAPDMEDGALGRNTFRAPGLFSFDVALTKALARRSERRFLMRAEVFNLFNHPNFGIPVRILESPGFGSSVNTTIPARTIQFAVKYSF